MKRLHLFHSLLSTTQRNIVCLYLPVDQWWGHHLFIKYIHDLSGVSQHQVKSYLLFSSFAQFQLSAKVLKKKTASHFNYRLFEIFFAGDILTCLGRKGLPFSCFGLRCYRLNWLSKWLAGKEYLGVSICPKQCPTWSWRHVTSKLVCDWSKEGQHLSGGVQS